MLDDTELQGNKEPWYMEYCGFIIICLFFCLLICFFGLTISCLLM